MMHKLSPPEFDCAALEPPTTPEEQVIVLLLDALQRLADAGEVDAACRIAGKASVTLGRSNAKSERRFNALLHHLTRKLKPVEQAESVNSLPRP